MSLARQHITALTNLEEVVLDSNFELNLYTNFGTITSLVKLTELSKKVNIIVENMPDDWTTLKELQQITELAITEKSQEQKNVVKTYKTIDQLMELLATLKGFQKLKFDGFNYNYNIQNERLQNRFIDTIRVLHLRFVQSVGGASQQQRSF